MPCPFAYVGKWFFALFVGVKVVQVFLYNRFRIKDEKKDDVEDNSHDDKRKDDTPERKVNVAPTAAEEGKKTKKATTKQ